MSKYSENEYIKVEGVYLPAILNEIKKHDNPFQSFFEAFTNSLESIKINKDENGVSATDSSIILSLYYSKDLLGEKIFKKVMIEDDGVGFDDIQFERFSRLKDSRKGINNKGSGRVQFINYFANCSFVSTYKSGDKYYERNFNISKSKVFIENSAIVKHNYTNGTQSNRNKTILTLSDLLEPEKDEKKLSISIDNLKIEILRRYIQYFCSHRDSLPQIILNEYIDEEFIRSIGIFKEEIPVPDKEESFTVNYSKKSSGNVNLCIKLDKTENFKFISFKLKKTDFKRNEIYLVSKDELIDNKDFRLKFYSLSPEESLDDMKYFILISSQYLNNKDSDIRGKISILKKGEFLENDDLFSDSEEILFDDIEINVNDVIHRIYPEIDKKNIEKESKIANIKKMFLFNDEVLKDLSISFNDSEDRIIEKLHKAESKIFAKGDSAIYKQLKDLDLLNPIDKDFNVNLNSVIEKLTKEIPLQNRASLTHYVARRKIMLELLDKILKRKLEVQNDGGRNNDEQLLHNIIFQQSATNPNSSDLWLINEDFIYFNGTSETQIKNIKIDGVSIIKDDLTPDEINYITSLDENRLSKRTDILLFPSERKCIIIELKNPDKNVSEHLNQINRYATLLRNLTKDKYQFDTFYGYLIGEKVDSEDIRDFDSDFKYAYHFDYVFRPHKIIVGKNGRNDGSLYTEVIKYSTLLQRAKKRNEIFIEKLQINNDLELNNIGDDDMPF